jgi:hypothetical protein
VNVRHGKRRIHEVGASGWLICGCRYRVLQLDPRRGDGLAGWWVVQELAAGDEWFAHDADTRTLAEALEYVQELVDDDPASEVAALPRRVAHATHALLAAAGQMPLKASEILLYDVEALSAASTGAALREAARKGLVANAGGLWFPRERAHRLQAQLEDRFLAETGDED